MSGVKHWRMQRLTAMGLIPLVLYVIVGLIVHTGADYLDARAWMAHPFNATATMLVFIVGYYHASLGIQVIIEDYIASHKTGLLILIITKLAMTALAALALFSVLKIAFT